MFKALDNREPLELDFLTWVYVMEFDPIMGEWEWYDKL